jgi:hypothetical protein
MIKIDNKWKKWISNTSPPRHRPSHRRRCRWRKGKAEAAPAEPTEELILGVLLAVLCSTGSPPRRRIPLPCWSQARLSLPSSPHLASLCVCSFPHSCYAPSTTPARASFLWTRWAGLSLSTQWTGCETWSHLTWPLGIIVEIVTIIYCIREIHQPLVNWMGFREDILIGCCKN